MESQLGPMLSDSQKAAITTALKKQDPARSVRRLSAAALRIDELTHLPSPPASRPTTHAFVDKRHPQEQKLQLQLLCAALNGNIPQYPKACLG